jgi:hypothetical protein
MRVDAAWLARISLPFIPVTGAAIGNQVLD